MSQTSSPRSTASPPARQSSIRRSSLDCSTTPLTTAPLELLTRREQEVLDLMAEGLTDRGIAERLYVTPNTVETHVRHIMGKRDLPATPADNRRVRAVLTYLRSGDAPLTLLPPA